MDMLARVFLVRPSLGSKTDIGDAALQVAVGFERGDDALGDGEKLALAQSLRAIVRHLEQGPASPAS